MPVVRVMAPRRDSLPSGLAGRQELLVLVAGLEVTGIGDPVAQQGEESALVLEEVAVLGGQHRVGQPGRLIEFNPTEKIFSNPDEKATEDYISGRFG